MKDKSAIKSTGKSDLGEFNRVLNELAERERESRKLARELLGSEELLCKAADDMFTKLLYFHNEFSRLSRYGVSNIADVPGRVSELKALAAEINDFFMEKKS